jgi:hypothetical protein
VTSVRSTDRNGDGIADSRSTETATYDAQDRMLTDVYEFDADADGVTEDRMAYRLEYSATGRTRRSVQEYQYGPGAAIQRSEQSHEFDAEDNLIRSATTIDDDDDGDVDFGYSLSLTYRADGRLQGTVQWPDYDGNGVLESRIETNYLYDSADTLRTVIRRTIYPDYEAGEGVSIGVPTTRTEYGADGELLSTSTGFDFDGDQVAEQLETRTIATHALIGDGAQVLTREYLSGDAAVSAF